MIDHNSTYLKGCWKSTWINKCKLQHTVSTQKMVAIIISYNLSQRFYSITV